MSAEEGIARAKEYFDAILEHIPAGVAILDGRDFRYAHINRYLADINGLSIAEHLGKTIAEVLPEAAQHIVPRLQRVLDTGQTAGSAEFGARLPGNPDEIRYFLDRFFPILGSDGKPRAVGAVVVDITERKRAEAANAAHASEARFRAMLEWAPDAMVLADRSGRILLVNTQTEKLFGYDREELIGQTVEKLIPDRFCPGHIDHRTSYVAAPHPRPMGAGKELFARRKDGREFPVEISLSPLAAHGETVVISAIRDVTERKKLEVARAQAEEDARRRFEELTHATRVSAMGELTASLAHEIRQPLTAILSNAQAAQRFLSAENPDLNELREILADIIKDNKRAGEVIQRVRALVGKAVPEKTEVLNLNQVISDVLPLMRSNALIKGVKIVTEFASYLPSVRGDRTQLQQVILNLLLNGTEAMKICPPGACTLVVRTARHGLESVIVSVQDCGTGVIEESLEQLFTAFYTTKVDGMGMGLSIARSIVELHDGHILASNNPDRGATFSFVLPVLD